ncbi:MAG: DUF3300 domain-containing protein [Syntrophotaleaceae bacterium]
MTSYLLTHLPASLLVIALFATGFALSPSRSQAEDYTDMAYSREELAQMLAPIALYPDALLSQVLMASTYPIEVIEADRWLRANPHLQGDALDDALIEENWDPSVKALCHFPSVLASMSEQIAETTDLGNAFLGQEQEVMDTVQELRAAAYERGNLYSTSAQRVIVERETIVIQPTSPRVVYVPYYDPWTIYGSWWYPAYPPWSWGPPGVRIGFGISYWPGVYFSFSFGSWTRFDWHRHHIHIDVHHRPRYVRHDHWISKSGPWRHETKHRHGVVYRHRPTAEKYGQQPRHWTARRNVADLSKDRPAPGDRRGENRNHFEHQRFERSRSSPDRRDRPDNVRSRTRFEVQDRQRDHRDPRQNRRLEAVQDLNRRTESEKQRWNRNIQVQRETDRKREAQFNRGRQLDKERDRSSRQSKDQLLNHSDQKRQTTHRLQTAPERQIREREIRDLQQNRQFKAGQDPAGVIRAEKHRQLNRDHQVQRGDHPNPMREVEKARERSRIVETGQWQNRSERHPQVGSEGRQGQAGGRDLSGRNRDSSQGQERGRDGQDRNQRFTVRGG